MKRFTESIETIKFGRHDISVDELLYKDSDFYIKYDNYPVSPGHILIITNGPELDYFKLSDSKKSKLLDMIEKSKAIIEEENTPDGYNIGMNCGKASGQTVMQFHCHLIPRYNGDVEDPAGGVRHCVMGKGSY